MRCVKCNMSGCSCLFQIKKPQPVCKKCAGTAQMEELAEINSNQKEAMSVGTIIQFGHNNEAYHSLIKRYASQVGCTYSWQGKNNDLHKAAEVLKTAAMVAIWNGKQVSTALAAELCRKRGIPHFFFEQGMLPQSASFFVDPKGFCGDSVLNGDLSWVTDADMERLYAKRKELQKQYPLAPEDFILAPLQIHNDAQVLYYSQYKNMDEFIADVESLYPDDRIVARPHPKGGKKHSFGRAEEVFEGDFLAWAARAKEVVCITSTCLYEAAILGVPVRALGDHPLATHPRELHDKVCAGALALCVPRGGDIKPVLDRFQLAPKLQKGTKLMDVKPDKYLDRKSYLIENSINFPQKDFELRQLCEEVEKRKPKVFVEVGTRYGSSLWMLSHYLPKDCEIVSIDMVGGAWGNKDAEKTRGEIIDLLRGEGRTVHLIDGNSQEESTRDKLKVLLDGKQIDFLFLDADHTYRGVLRDWELYHPLVADNGMVAFHDIFEAKEHPRIKVHFLWRVLKTLYKWKEFAADPGGAMGIGIVEYRKVPKFS